MVATPPSRSVAPNGAAALGLCASASKRTTPLHRLIERDFKDASEEETRKIVRESVAQLYGFDFD